MYASNSDSKEHNPFWHFRLKDFLNASFSEPTHNLGSNLTEKLFFEHFFVQTPQFEQTRLLLDTKIDPVQENKSIIFLNGFSGNGKTTFLRWFIHADKMRKYDHHYINVANNSFYFGQKYRKGNNAP